MNRSTVQGIIQALLCIERGSGYSTGLVAALNHSSGTLIVCNDKQAGELSRFLEPSSLHRAKIVSIGGAEQSLRGTHGPILLDKEVLIDLLTSQEQTIAELMGRIKETVQLAGSRDAVVALMDSSRNAEEWEANADKVKAAYGDQYPGFWHESILEPRNRNASIIGSPEPLTNSNR